MGFRFRFETLLRVRKIREDLAMQEFSKIQKHLKDLEMLKSFNESKRSDTRQQFIQKIDAGLKSADIATYQSYLSRLDAEIGQLDKLIIQAGRQLDTKRGAAQGEKGIQGHGTSQRDRRTAVSYAAAER